MPRLRLWKLALVILLFTAVYASAQEQEDKLMDPAAHPKFEIATIKLADPSQQGSGFSIRGTTVLVRNKTMREIFSVAFNVHEQQLVNMPDWFDQRFDIKGHADVPGTPSWPQYQQMVHALLFERLGLKVHHETRDMSRFTMQVARGGVRFGPTKYTGVDLPDQTGNGTAGTQEWKFTNNTMGDFSEFLRSFLSKPVIDETQLKGKYDFELRWSREDAEAGADTKNLPGLLTALQEQLGLKVEAGKGPTDVIVIDHVERPSEN